MTGSGVAGTPSYMAPELHTAGTAGVESDVYSLGCLLWAAVTGTAPYRGTSDYQIATSHFVEPIPQLAGDDAAIAETNRILRTAMAKQPGDRYPSAAALRDDLRRALSLAQATESVAADPSAPSAGDPSDSGDRAALGRPSAPSPPTRRPGRRPGRGGRRRRHRGRVRADGSQRRSRDRSGARSHHQSEREYDADESLPRYHSPPMATVPRRSPASPRDSRPRDGLTEAQANCTARQWLKGDGLQAMIDDGFFDEDMVYLDKDKSEMSPEMQQVAVIATVACAGAT